LEENIPITADQSPPEPVYPPKPLLEERKYAPGKTLISLIAYVALYYTFFSKDLSYILLLMTVLFIHELGHLIAMRAFGYKDLGMFFVPLLGAYVSGETNRPSQRKKSIILLAGPVPGMIIGIGFFILFTATFQDSYYRTALVFLVLNMFNLLPVSPLIRDTVLRVQSQDTGFLYFIVYSCRNLS
jgi:stage IV sporulation protein FB